MAVLHLLIPKNANIQDTQVTSQCCAWLDGENEQKETENLRSEKYDKFILKIDKNMFYMG